ncbi:helix-turn-helix domain-containing protein [Paenibacillus graminis]|uniref:HTH cro/C1-type domain-containing protein n=1 Tax=Paenibacillus graminis TaxID=189425 RepID=A0A089M6T1_9BACL|nr:hypothetical protein PGRAT_19070 [Paenibacillus graminis]
MSALSFGEYLKQLRKAKGFKTARMFARKVGISNATISRIESGEIGTSPQMIRKLSESLGVTHPAS